MKTYLSDAAVFDSVTNKVIRTHPEWGVNDAHPADRYYDFKADPSLIPRVLDSFKGWKDWSGWEGVQLFYGLLEWMNGPDSRLESSGCGFIGPHGNAQQDRWPGRLVTTGGLIFLFRDVALNLSAESAAWAARPAPVGSPPAPLAPGKNISWLVGRSLESLQELSPEFTGGCLTITLFTTFYSEPPLERKDKFGHEVAYQWWAWGDTVEETMAHFKQVVATMFECLKRISDEAATIAG